MIADLDLENLGRMYFLWVMALEVLFWNHPRAETVWSVPAAVIVAVGADVVGAADTVASVNLSVAVETAVQWA